MSVSSAKVEAMCGVIADVILDVPKIQEIYRGARLERPGRIHWSARTSEEIWTEVLERNWLDLELTLFPYLEKIGFAAQARQMRALYAAADDGQTASTARRLASAHHPETLHLRCDREAQWEALTDAANRPPLTLYLLGGAEGTGHGFFLERIRAESEQVAGAQPAATRVVLESKVLEVYPPGVDCPTTFDEAIAGLRDVLDGDLGRDVAKEEVGPLLAAILERHNVFLMHRLVALKEVAVTWLPRYVEAVIVPLLDAIARGRTQRSGGPLPGTLVAVIPLEWSAGDDGFLSLVDRLREISPETQARIVAPNDLVMIGRRDVEALLNRMTRGLDVPAIARRITATHDIDRIYERLQDELRRIPRRSFL